MKMKKKKKEKTRVRILKIRKRMRTLFKVLVSNTRSRMFFFGSFSIAIRTKFHFHRHKHISNKFPLRTDKSSRFRCFGVSLSKICLKNGMLIFQRFCRDSRFEPFFFFVIKIGTLHLQRPSDFWNVLDELCGNVISHKIYF